jgi:hypothetical protein
MPPWKLPGHAAEVAQVPEALQVVAAVAPLSQRLDAVLVAQYVAMIPGTVGLRIETAKVAAGHETVAPEAALRNERSTWLVEMPDPGLIVVV